MIAPDQQIRDAAVNIQESFIVSAPAGSGKTALLTLRILELLACVQKPEEILAITFTRKAAREMQERVVNAIESALESSIDLAALNAHELKLHEAAKRVQINGEKHGWDLTRSSQRLKISTIDAFCKQLCNQLPFFSGVGLEANVLDDALAEYQLVADRWIDNVLAEQDSDMARQLLEHFSGNLIKLRDMLASLLGIRDQWLPLLISGAANQDILRPYFENAVYEWVEESVSDIAVYLYPYEAELLDLVQYAYSNIGDASKPELFESLARYDGFPSDPKQMLDFWPKFVEFLCTGDGFRKTVDKRHGFPAGASKEEKTFAKEKKQQFISILREIETSDLAIDNLVALKKLPISLFTEKQWQLVETLIGALPSLSAQLKLRFIELGKADFTEFSIGAVTALQSQDSGFDLQQRLDYRIQHILIDEFQDTSSLQMELLKALTREWVPGDGKTLFLVGDGMQSCYRFRNANVGIFIKMRHEGLENLQPIALDLNTNFRSTPTIVSWVNNVFRFAFPDLDNINLGAVKYIDSQTISNEEANDVSFVKCVSFEKSGSDRAEAQYFAKEIKQLRTTYPEDSIAVLVRSRAHSKPLFEAFTEHGIPYQAQDIDPLSSKQHIIDIDNLARLLDDPEDEISFLSLLRSPFCALNNADLHAVFECIRDKENEGQLLVSKIREACESSTLSHSGGERLKRCLQKLDLYLLDGSRHSFTQLVELLWLRLGGPETLETQSDLMDVERYLDLLSKHEKNNLIENWELFSQSLAKLYASPMQELVNPVQVMTMHKSKGLEFDSVFLPSLEKGKPPQTQTLLNWCERINEQAENKFILSPVSDETESNPLSEFLRHHEAQKSNIEDTRVFYVACTRAKKRLYLSAYIDIDDKGKVKIGKQSLLAKIWDCTSEQFEHMAANLNSPAPEIDTPEAHKNGAPYLQYLPDTWWDNITQHFGDQVLANKFDNSDYNFFEDWSDDSLELRERGILFHEILRCATEYGLVGYIKRDLAAVFSEWRNLVFSLNLKNQYSDLVFKEFVQHLESLAKHEPASWALGRFPFEKNEWSLWQRKASNTVQFIIDRSFIENDTCWIVDYKTAVPREDETIDTFLEAEKSSYRDQLTNYRTLVASYLKSRKIDHVKNIRCALLFVFLPHWETLNELDIEI